MGVPELKREVLQQCDLLQAALAFNFKLDLKQKDALATIRSEVPSAPARRLRQFRDLLKNNMQRAAKGLPCQPKWKFLQGFVDKQFGGKFGYAYIPKYILEQIFSDFSQLVPKWASIPAQTLIGFDFAGEYNQVDTFEYFLSEIALYEDMCFAYNQAVGLQYKPRAGSVDKVRRKAHEFYLRTAVLSAFYMVEAHFNGIAFDFCVRTKGDRKLSEQEEEKLTEWSSQWNRERWVSFRDKILQYPKIILGLKDPPLTEDTCEEIKILTEEARVLRDSLVHNSPKIDLVVIEGKRHLISPKIQSIFELDLAKATRIVDASVGLLKRLNSILAAYAPKLEWLHERTAAGPFPEDVFT